MIESCAVEGVPDRKKMNATSKLLAGTYKVIALLAAKIRFYMVRIWRNDKMIYLQTLNSKQHFYGRNNPAKNKQLADGRL